MSEKCDGHYRYNPWCNDCWVAWCNRRKKY